MIELTGLSEPVRGRRFVLRRLPATLGRAADNDLVLEAPGVWDQHLCFELDRHAGVRVRVVAPEARLWINDRPAAEARLAPGDCLAVGGLTLRFTLAPPQPGRWSLATVLTWGILWSVMLLEALLLTSILP